MYPTFVLIRHAQSMHNQIAQGIAKQMGNPANFKSTPEYKQLKLNQDLCDGGITELGFHQAAKVQQNFNLDDIDIVIVSPLRRALQTCETIFKDRLDKVKIFVEPSLTELLTSAIDIGSKLKESREMYGKVFDFSKIAEKDDEVWYLNIIQNEQTKKQIKELAEQQKISIKSSAVKMLRNGPLESLAELKKRIDNLKEELTKYKIMSKKKVALIGHSYSLRYLTATGFYEDFSPINGMEFENCEVKEVPIIIDGYFEQDQDIVPFCRIP